MPDQFANALPTATVTDDSIDGETRPPRSDPPIAEVRTGDQTAGPAEPWDETRANSYVGKTLVVGFNHATLDGALIEKVQRAGVIVAVHPEDGIVVRQGDGREFQLPPALHGLRQAQPGAYTLRSTGEIVHDPDYEMIWTIWGFGTDDASWALVTRNG
jgi:hypothetical protein